MYCDIIWNFLENNAEKIIVDSGSGYYESKRRQSVGERYKNLRIRWQSRYVIDKVLERNTKISEHTEQVCFFMYNTCVLSAHNRMYLSCILFPFNYFLKFLICKWFEIYTEGQGLLTTRKVRFLYFNTFFFSVSFILFSEPTNLIGY
jgi:hypothetical protein